MPSAKSKLIIVESPAKARTITKFLGKGYKVEASQGHVRDLPKSQIGVDIEHDFEPKYITIRGRGDILAAIRKEAKNCHCNGCGKGKNQLQAEVYVQCHRFLCCSHNHCNKCQHGSS